MGMFGRKEKKAQEEKEKLEKRTEQYNLNDLSEENKKSVKLITDKLMGTTLVGLGSTAGEQANLRLQQAMIDQNFLMIKLLNEINDKLDK